MSKIEVMRQDALSESPSTPGITRHLAFTGEGVKVLRSRADPGTISGWHEHGDYHVYGYVSSGTVRFESGPGGTEVVNLSPGDFFHVPPHTVHRESNPSGAGGEVILFLQGTGPTVSNVEHPES